MSININNSQIVCPHKLTDSVNNRKVVTKQWGIEFILPGHGYTTKIMQIKPGFKSSLHFHQHKNETFVLVQGQLNVEFYEPDSEKRSYELIEPLSCLILPACTPHSFSVPKTQEGPSIFIESSTVDDADDNYRLTRSGIDA